MSFKFIPVLLLVVWSCHVLAQKPNIIPPSPNAASFSKYGDVPVNLSTGTASIDIPIYKCKEGSLTWPVSLNYTYTGYRPSEEIGWVGRGWSLTGGVITRTVHGRKDEGGEGYDGYLTTGPTVRTNVQNRENNIPVDLNFVTQIAQGLKDGEPDIFNFSFGKYSGKFFFGTDGAIYNTVGQALKIEYGNLTFPLDPGSGHNFVGPTFTKWTITTEDGVKYIFNKAEYGWSLFGNESFDKFNKTISAWHLSQIIGTKGETIKFFYSAPTDQYKRIQASYAQKKVLPLPNVGSPLAHFVADDDFGINRNYSEEIFLTKIQGTNWELQFNSTQQNKLVNGETSYYQKLNQIVLRNISQPASPVQIRTFDFTYNTNNSDLLAQFQEKNGTLVVNPYVFTYKTLNNVGLTYSIDNWGYYNGTGNSGLISEFGADRQAYLDGTVQGALETIQYPTKGSTKFEYELNTSSYVQTADYLIYRVVYDYYGFVWRKTEDGLVVIQSQPFSIPEERSYESNYQFDYTNTEPPCHPLTESGTLNANYQYTAADFTPHPCISSDMPVNGEININIKIKRIIIEVAGPVGGLRIKRITNYKANSVVSTFKDYIYTNFQDATRSSGTLADSINTSAVIRKYYSASSYCSAQIWKSEAVNTNALTPIHYFNVEEKIGNIRQLNEFSTFRNNYLDSYGLMMAGGGSTMFGPTASFAFIRGLPVKTTNYRSVLTNKSSEQGASYPTASNVVMYSSPAIYSENIADYNTANGTIYGNADNHEYYVKCYKTIAGWVRKDIQTTTDYGSAGTSPHTVITTNTYGNPLHRQLTQSRTTQSDGSILENNYKYPHDYNVPSVPVKAPYILRMIDSNMVAYPLEHTTVLERSPTDRKYIDAETTTYRSMPSRSALKQTLMLPYKRFVLKGFDGSIPGFTPYSGSSDEATLTSYRGFDYYNNYDSTGNLLNITSNAITTSYLWSFNRQFLVAEIQNVNYATLNSALTTAGTSFWALAKLNTSEELKVKLDAIRTALTNAQTISGQTTSYLMTHYLYTRQEGQGGTLLVSSVSDPAGKVIFYEYDGLGRLTNVRNSSSSGSIRSSYCYNYAGQGTNCGSIAATGIVTPAQLYLLAEGSARMSADDFDFFAAKEERTALLSWSTNIGSAARQFDVEHSLDGKGWKTIGHVDADSDGSGQGNDTLKVYYAFQDANPADGDNFYRIKIRSLDSLDKYSGAEKLVFETQRQVYPNPLPIGKKLQLDTPEKISNIRIYDLSGNMVYSSDSPGYEVDIAHLPTGMYIVQVTGTNRAVTVHRVVKE